MISMRLSFILRHRQRLLMPLDPSRHLQASSSSSLASHLKRSHSQNAYALDDVPDRSSSQSIHAQSFGVRSATPTPPPKKVPRVEETMSQHQHSSKGSLARTHHPQTSGRFSNASKSSVKRRGKASRRDAHIETIVGPVHTQDYIKEAYEKKPLKSGWVDNPKSALLNWCNARSLKADCQSSEMYTPDGQLVWRVKMTIDFEGETFVSYGDHPRQKNAEAMASLCMLYILDGRDLTSAPKQPKLELSPTEGTLTDGTVIDFQRARQFMDYYCRRFNFGKPDIAYTERKNIWEAVMTVGGRRIGMGTATNKKLATETCYVDVAKYLESCDVDLWKQFVEDAKTGRDLGLAPAVTLQVDDRLEDRIQTLCADIKSSLLYKNRPRISSLMTGDDDPNAFEEDKPAPSLYVPPSRRRATAAFLEEKSKKLLARRQEYLLDPKMEKMRHTRSSLPVYTKAQAVLDHIKDNDVTICMATTGSGKTTQLPQLILDEWIERGEGAKCNIVCTQPRRLAAISVANRVAAERGESTGQSVGYQVRFETNLPQPHGSITFCTTGIFLKRMQNDLLGGRHDRALDDVTHILVDEVHERDVDTDLLLVVLKRLLADRKSRGLPIKIVLMSATIDPSLFQQYFKDDNNLPATVTEIPGRSFPVEKHFLDEFISDIAKSAPQASRMVFNDDNVRKYLTASLDPPSLLSLLGVDIRRGGRFSSTLKQDEDVDVPAPLVALTVSHVLRNSSDGHVLVFLPGWEDISAVQKALRGMSLGLDFNSSKFSIHCLHSSIPVAEQQIVFDPPPEGQRRIILSTNIAETSVTIPDVVYVVDTAKLKEQRYNPEKHISSLVSAPVGKSNLNQRAGRAGRHRPGEYYGLLTRQRADALETHQMVEMKRVDLSNVVMHVKALDFPGMTVEEVLEATIEPPAVERVEAAMKSLKMVGALDSKKQLTSLGRVLLQLPLDVQMGRLVLYGCFFKCLEPALTLAALLTNRDPFLSPIHLKKEAAACKNSFSPDEYRSDAIAMLRAYNAWWEMQSRGQYMAANSFCVTNFLSKPTLMSVHQVKTQLLQTLYSIGVIDVSAGGVLSSDVPRGPRSSLTVPPELNQHAESLPVLVALIAIALQPKFAIRTGSISLRTAQDKMVMIHPSSVNNRKRLDVEEQDSHREKELIAFVEKRQNLSVTGQKNPNMYLVTTTRLDPLTYILFGAYHLDVTRKGLECDEWLPIVGSLDALDDLERLKVLMESCMLRVFQGIIKAQTKNFVHQRITNRHDGREDESGDEDDDAGSDSALTATEIQELDLMTRDIVRVLTEYNNYRIATQSRHNSRPGTPISSPGWRPGRLPPMGNGTRSGYTTPHHGPTGQFHSRPSTPSRLR